MDRSADRASGSDSPRVSSSRELITWLREELAPAPGRAAATVRIAANCTITVITGMVFEIPLPAYMAYVVFLAFAFHGPSHWQGNQMEFGAFIDHFTFMAGLFFAAVHGPGDKWAMRRGALWK